MTEAELKQWIIENLCLEVRLADRGGPNNDVYVELRFVGEKYPFSSDRIAIPSKE